MSSKIKKPKILVIPDCQVKPGVPLDHLKWCNNYIKEKKPDTVICIGDFADMHSLSSYDKGKKEYEGRSYREDIECAKDAMSLLLKGVHTKNQPVHKERSTTKSKQRHSMEMVLTLGNHENRIFRAINEDRKLDGTISIHDLGYSQFGWNVIPYLHIYKQHGILFSHYFTSGVLDRPVTSARALLTKKHRSAVMGHVQKRDIAYDYTADGKQITAIFAGTFYQHDESYMSAQANKHWRGIWMLHQCDDGEFDEMPVSMQYLQQQYS
jgi:Calcineurin-like phosphoesterase